MVNLPLNIDSLNKIRDLIYKEKTTIIFAPDPWFAQDFHADHLNTGRLVYFSLKKLKKDFRSKKVLYYYSTKRDYHLKCKCSEFKIIKKAVSKHKSQYSILQSKLIVAFYNKLSIIKHFLETGTFSESFREKKFDKNRNPLPPIKFEDMSFRERIIYYLFSNFTIRGFVKFYNLSLREIGFKINYDNRDVLKLLDKRYIYKNQINKEFKSQ